MITIEEALDHRRAATAAAWELSDEVVVVGAGEPIGLPGRLDPTYPFMAHAEYFYLTDRNLPSGVLAFDPKEGWVDFVAPITEADRVWSGALAEDPGGPTTDDLDAWLGARTGRRIAVLGAAVAGVSPDAELTERLHFALSAVRRRKDEVEIERIRVANLTSVAAYAAAVPMMCAGVTERQVQIEFEAAAYRAGADRMAYDSIVGGGPNSAILHFAPTNRAFRDGELVLIDAGGEYRGYASDVTRTYPVGGQLDPEQAELHALVRMAEMSCIERCGPGVEWRDVHLNASLVLAEGLVSFGVLRGAPESLVESGAVALFFPHGVGHLVGLGVRDAGGIVAERKDDPPPFPNLRINLPLETGFVVTVEPGIYFVPAILSDPERRGRLRDEVDWDRVDRMLGFGGIRIEDNVMITADGYEVLTVEVPLL
ncbi:MAG TPA: aminopeptidase P family protein [Solirubrobacteraceae bacterium]|nr:aminopeptidase P family protein [Solirubrobacteraceae bacterium]